MPAFLTHLARSLTFMHTAANAPQEDWGSASSMQSADGFHWRHGIERDTVGMWIWSKPFVRTLPDGRRVAVIVADTQVCPSSPTRGREGGREKEGGGGNERGRQLRGKGGAQPNTHTFAHTYAHTHIHTYAHTHTHTHTHIHMYTHIHAHSRTFTHIHTYTHTHACPPNQHVRLLAGHV